MGRGGGSTGACVRGIQSQKAQGNPAKLKPRTDSASMSKPTIDPRDRVRKAKLFRGAPDVVRARLRVENVV